MKKNRFLTGILIAAMVLASAFAPTASTATARINPITPEVFTIANGYLYNTDRHLNTSPDTMEAWIMIPTTSLGGTIAGNRIGNDDKGMNVSAVNWCVDIHGKPVVEWDDMQMIVTFDGAESLFDGEWHHIAIVRTNQKWSYYKDGVLEDEQILRSFPVYSQDSMNIGACNRGWIEQRTTFEGYIEQFTLYDGAITAEQVALDMQNKEINHDDVVCDGANLIGNWYLGREWTARTVENTVDGGSTAVLHTQSKYVGVDWDFEYDYSFAIVPDIQIMTHYNNNRINNMTQWMVNYKSQLNMQFVMFVGDLADSGGDPENTKGNYDPATQEDPIRAQYRAAANAMAKLDNKLPYCFVPGNHDHILNFSTSALHGVRDTRYFNEFFPLAKHSKLPGFGGTQHADRTENNYYIFEVEGFAKYLVINLDFRCTEESVRWAGRVIDAHPDCRVIINRHDNLMPNRTFNQTDYAYGVGSQTLFNSLGKKFANVFFNIGGHHPTDDIEYRYDMGDHGNKVLSMLIDGQGTDYKGDGAQDMLLLCFMNETDKTMTCVYYSPEKDRAWNIQNMFQLSFADPLNPTIGA